MVRRYEALLRDLVADHAIARRIRNKLRHLANPGGASEYSIRQRIAIVWRLWRKGIAPGGPRRVFHFTLSFPWLAPRKMPQAILDWIAGLSMRDYVERHFAAPKKLVANES